MITIYVDPSDANQVMAYYRGCGPGDPSVWTDQGFVEVKVDEEHPQYRNLVRDQRECRFNDDVVTPRINSVQSVPSPSEIARRAARASGQGKLRALGLTDEEIEAL